MTNLKKHFCYWVTTIVLLNVSTLVYAEAPFQASQRFTHTLKSKYVDQEFAIYVQVPAHKIGSNERFPVLYETDSTAGLLLPGITAVMQMSGDVNPYISVGIGYPGDNFEVSLALRGRDLTPTETTSFSAESIYPFRDLPIPKKASGGADDFLKFIEQELIPFIDQRYPTIPGERGYWGDSLGGLFGLYVMFNRGELFNRYVIGSPSTWWDNELVMTQAETFAKSGKSLNARAYFAAGSLEEVGAAMAPFKMVTNVYRLDSILDQVEGLDLKVRIFPDETHSTVPPLNYTHGVRHVFGKPEVSAFTSHALEQAQKK